MKPWIKTGLLFALWMFVFMTFIVPFVLPLFGFEDEEKISVAKTVINAVVFTITGLGIGYINRNNNKGPKKQIDN